jgi:hypothetical protein
MTVWQMGQRNVPPGWFAGYLTFLPQPVQRM